MFKDLLSVGGITLVSRATGFLRDVALGALLGAGMAADAFYIAFRLPNHFRAIFGEGAFNAAFVPSYARVLEMGGNSSARAFAGQILTLLLLSQIVLLALAWLFTPQLVELLAPGFGADSDKFALAVALTRVTFPYLLFVTLVTLVTGALNANKRFAAGAFAPVLLNLAMIATLALAFLFPNAGYAAAAGVLVAGLLEFGFVAVAAWRAGIWPGLARPVRSANVRQFFIALGPAVIGSAGVQIALFADTIIASLLPTGAVSSIYYADRLYQLPIGVIGIAAGTVLLPEMSRRFAAGEPGAAFTAQNRTMAVTIALAAPFFVAFLLIPREIMRGVFLRGRFTESDALASANVLAAYGLGLMAIVLIASARASFQAKGDTKTPMYISLGAVAANVLLKIALYKPLGAAGLALATAIGAWINFSLLAWLAMRWKQMKPDRSFLLTCQAVAVASIALVALAMFFPAVAAKFGAMFGLFQNEIALATVGIVGTLVYGGVLLTMLTLFGVKLRRPRATAAATSGEG